MKKVIYLLILLSIIIGLAGCAKENTDNQNHIEENDTNNTMNMATQNQEERQPEENKEQANQNTQEQQQEKKATENAVPVEEELSSFSTKILAKEENRVNNISKACSTINGTVINSGEFFSFWKVIGNPTIEKGYQEAKAFTAKGGVTTAIGGGLCQVSSTIYNVVLNVPELETIERHQHTREVYYVKLGNDASVSYGGADFKFKNNLSTPIKIYADCTKDAVNIRFVKMV